MQEKGERMSTNSSINKKALQRSLGTSKIKRYFYGACLYGTAVLIPLGVLGLFVSRDSNERVGCGILLFIGLMCLTTAQKVMRQFRVEKKLILKEMVSEEKEG
jgi:hypothetical protein